MENKEEGKTKEKRKPNIIFPVILMIAGIARFAMTGKFIFLLLGIGWLILVVIESAKD